MNILKNKKVLIIVISVLVLILVIVGLVLFFTHNGKDNRRENNYDINDEIIDLPGTVTYTSDELNSKHCLKGICIENATFSYTDQIGKVEYTITNTSKKKKSGYLKMVFGNQTLLVVYKNLKPNWTVKSSSQYVGVEITDKNDYELKELTKEEISQIVK